MATKKPTRLFLSSCCASMLVLSACAHHETSGANVGRVGQTTLTSADIQRRNDNDAMSSLGHGADPRPIPDVVVMPMGGPVNGEAEAIAQALCERKLACDEVGPQRPFTSVDECLGPARRVSAARAANLASCPNGVRQGALESCVTALRAEACDDSLDVTQRVTACRMEAICR